METSCRRVVVDGGGPLEEEAVRRVSCFRNVPQQDAAGRSGADFARCCCYC